MEAVSCEIQLTQTGEVKETDADEVSSFLKTRNTKSAPGSDGIRWKHLKVMNKNRPKLLPELYNGCMKLHKSIYAHKLNYLRPPSTTPHICVHV